MGVMRFTVHPQQMLDERPEIYRAFISGFDGRVYPTRIEVDGNTITCRRQEFESGKLNLAWPVKGFGRPMVHTCSLIEREEAYLLPLELARGKIGKLRDQLGAWEIMGMKISEEFRTIFRQAQKLFTQAVSQQNHPKKASKLSDKAIQKAFEATGLLVNSYTNQRLKIRRRRSPQLPASLGCSLGWSPEENTTLNSHFRETFNAAVIPIPWKQIEPTEGETNWDLIDAQINWCRSQNLLIYGGPLLDFSPDGLPEWLWQWEHDFLNLKSLVCNFVETATSRYYGKIRIWEISARANTGGALALNEEHRLALAAQTLEVARQVDEEIQLMIRVDQPWGEYRARGQHHLSPLQFVDALVRSSIGLSGVNLEIAVGYQPQSCGYRDLLEFSKLIDLWNQLGVPLYVTLAFPSSSGTDPQAPGDLEVGSPCWKQPWNEAAQAEWIREFLPLLMSKESIVGIYWTHFSDATPHTFPHAGLVNIDGSPKQAHNQFVQYRHEFWKTPGHQ